MKQVNRILSTYTADVMGVSSALYELGGLIVMHDPSGCNSTYATHDEPRWFTKPSAVYISALEQFDALLGRDEKLINDIAETAVQLKPEFIAIAGTIIPSMLGTDFKAVAKLAEQRTGIPAFGFATNSMHSYVLGANTALAEYAKRFCPDETAEEKESGSVNLLGVTPLDFSVTGNAEALKTFFENKGLKVNSVWAMNSAPEELKRAGKAEINVVVSSCGFGAAEVLKEKYGTPYITGCPVGKAFSEEILCAIKNKSDIKQPEIKPSKNYIIGEVVTACSIRAALKRDFGIDANVICPTEYSFGQLLENDAEARYEDEIETALRGAELVIADPMYLPVISPETKFIPFPHEACSGRIYRKDIPIFIGSAFNEWIEKEFS